ncbi:hypothetical protein PCANC_12952 [Puccinia coronata f. sp. avenae]|uniref:Uncharacterized protein n=1 Tax=Puccinia coronata f. sp. avenae TaxID=200324 RepID=A0A2N5SMS5_9BASI|nr:hypothetical protein PCANC_12952 [Puccinia coronata f. sp. avenae]
MVATSLRLLAIIVLFQLGWALATATAAQSTQTDILFTHDFPSTSIIRTKWQGTCSFILAKIPRFQRQSDSERLWIAADSSYRHWSIPHCLGKSTSGKFRPRESPESAAFEPTSPTLTRPLADSPSGAVILLAADAPAKGVTPGNRFRSIVPKMLQRLLLSFVLRHRQTLEEAHQSQSHIRRSQMVQDINEYPSSSSLYLRFGLNPHVIPLNTLNSRNVPGPYRSFEEPDAYFTQ